MNRLDSKHDYFDRLCALSAANQATLKEEKELAEHAQSCPSCAQAIAEYRQIVYQTYSESLDDFSVTSSSGYLAEVADERSRAKERLFAKLNSLEFASSQSRISLTDSGREPSASVRNRRSVSPWIGWAVAAAMLLALTFELPQFWTAKKQSEATEARAQSLQLNVDALKGELARSQANPHETAPKADTGKQKEIEKLRTANQSLQRELDGAESAREQEATKNAELWNRIRLLQSSLDTLDTARSNWNSERAGLSERIASLTAEVQKSRNDFSRITAQNEDLSRQSVTQVRSLERQQKLLATDHDIRDILGSRSLRIIDVYDVTSQGEFARPFGRIFYSSGKFLIFYAFDLDKEKGLKRGAVFQAWGEKAKGKEDPVNLGAFYVDDESQNRWVLKVDDGRVLSSVESVFVTDSSHKVDKRPRGKPLLSAFLGESPVRP